MIQIRKVPRQDIIFVKKAVRANIYLIRTILGKRLEKKLKGKVNIRGPVIEVTQLRKKICDKEKRLERIERKDVAKQLNNQLNEQINYITHEIIVS